MSTIHSGTTMAPTKLELLTTWLPRQPWYLATGVPPALRRAGGFRLDDPAGEVGIEFMLVGDGEETTYLVPMTYRSAPLDGADEALIGTSEHGVLGTRWIYDAAHDPVAVTQLLDFICGGCEAQSQSTSDTPDPTVGRHWASAGRLTIGRSLWEPSSESGEHYSLDLVRVLQPGPEADPGDGVGSVTAEWTRLDGSTARGPVAVVRATAASGGRRSG